MTKPKKIASPYELQINAMLQDMLALQAVEVMLPPATYKAALRDRIRRLVVNVTSQTSIEHVQRLALPVERVDNANA